MAADDHQPAWIASPRDPRDHIVGRSIRAGRMHEWIAPYLQAGNGAVLVEDEFARGGNAMPRLGLIGARVTGSESLECQVSVLDVVRIYAGNHRANVRVRLHATLRKCGKSRDEYESADDQG